MSRDTAIEYGMITGTSSGASGITSVLDSIGFALNIVCENTCGYVALMERRNLIDILADIKNGNSALSGTSNCGEVGGNE